MTGVRTRGGDTRTEGRPCEDAGRRWPSKAWKNGLRRNQHCRQLDLKHLAPRTVRKRISVIYATQASVIFWL